jgi:integrase/recombinase XerD
VTIPNELERDVDAIRLPQWGRVARTDGVVPYEVEGADGQPIEPVRRYLRDFVAQGRRAGSVRSYAYDLLRWWRWLQVCGAEWDKVSSAEVREFVLWLQRTTKPRRTARRRSAATAGTINPITRKQYRGTGTRPARSVIAMRCCAASTSFGSSGVPVRWSTRSFRNAAARGGRTPNTTRLSRLPGKPASLQSADPQTRPPAMSDQQWDALFAALRSDRDRALASLVISNASRAGEILGIRYGDIDWGSQLVRVRRKGAGAEQWLPASADAFVWLRLYLDSITPLAPSEPIWWTLRRGRRGDGSLGLATAELRRATSRPAARQRRPGDQLDHARPAAHLRPTDAA